MCLRHAAAARTNTPDKAVCTVAVAYVKAVRHEGLHLNLPQSCLTCGRDAIGSRKRYTGLGMAGAKKADVIFVIEESDCNRDLVKELPSMVKSIENELGSEKMDAKFAIVAFGGPTRKGAAHVHTSRSRSLVDSKDLVLASRKLQFRTKASERQAADAYAALAFAADLQYRQGSSKNLVLVSCGPCNEQVSRFDYSDIQNMLLSEGITLHVVSNMPIQLRTASSSRQRGLFALDVKTVYTGRDLTQKDLEGQVDLRRQVAVPKDVCISLAQESGGSFFTTSPLNSDDASGSGRSVLSKTWKSLLSRRLVASAQPARCQHCDCVIDPQDGMTTRSVCRPCKAAKPLFNKLH
ncbi:Apolipophorin -like protein [Halotydeus destructor]|nr:Apolipophorin -like protein [Halotydeus destructor]